MIMNLSGGGKPQNVLVVYVKEADATITVTNSVKTLTNITDAAGYAYFTNLDLGTWTVSAVSSLNHPAPTTPTVTVTATQISYYVAFGFEFWLYDNSYADKTLNQCIANSGGWDVSAGSETATYISTYFNGGGSLHVLNSFDMSNYNTLSAYVNTSNGNHYNYIQVRASDKTTVIARAELATVTAEQWVTLDVSSITAPEAYIYVAAYQYDVVALKKCYLA